jgi:predicted metal-dependent phosphoesterase TrpH
MMIKNKENIKVDLHIHTAASDGTWTPKELINIIKEKDIGIFAVTDHDTFENIKEIKKLVENIDAKFIPGIEISSTYDKKNYHILGYGFDELNDSLELIINMNRNIFKTIDDEGIVFLSKRFDNISISEYHEFVHDTKIGGWKAFSYIFSKGICSNLREYFKLFDGTELEDPFSKVKLSNPAHVIEAIKNSNGIPVLAHPGVAFYDSDVEGVLKYFLEMGIMGVECYHPDNNEEVTNYCLSFCKENGLIITGGSDCHGTFIDKRKIGFPDIRLTQLSDIGNLLKNNK